MKNAFELPNQHNYLSYSTVSSLKSPSKISKHHFGLNQLLNDLDSDRKIPQQSSPSSKIDKNNLIFMRSTIGTSNQAYQQAQKQPKNNKMQPFLRKTITTSNHCSQIQPESAHKLNLCKIKSSNYEEKRKKQNSNQKVQQFEIKENEKNIDKLLNKYTEKQRLLTELKKINDDKISEKLKSTLSSDKKDYSKQTQSYINDASICEKQKNPESKSQIFVKKETTLFYTPKNDKPKYDYKVENRWTPKNYREFGEQKKQGLNSNSEKEVNFLSYSTIGNLPNNCLNLSSSYLKEYSNKEYKNIKDIRQMNDMKISKAQSSLHRKVSIHDFSLGKVLGEGKFGTVFLATHIDTKSFYALKKVPKQIIKSNMMIDQFLLEIKLQSFLNHENILPLFGCFDDSQNIYLVLEYMEEGTLFYQLKKNKILSEKSAAEKLVQIAEAIKYLHSHQVAHRDIKPENIVISNGVCKLCDFGWSALCSNERRKTYCGTFDYAAPEILEGREYDMAVDLWCLGILAYEILVGKAPFYHMSRKETMKRIINVETTNIEYPSHLSKNAISFIESLLKKKPEERLSADDLLHHPFLANTRLQNC